MSYISISKQVSSKYTVNKSIFISIAMPIDDVSCVKNYIDSIEMQYPDATHYCYAALTLNSAKCSDDGEPSGTAGMPILEVIKRKGLINVIVVVVRYYGGVKLGSGGLIRAYSQSASEILDAADKVTYYEAIIAEVTVNYSFVKPLNNNLVNAAILINTEYETTVTLTYKVLQINLDKFNEIVNDTTSCKAVISLHQMRMMPYDMKN